MRLKLNKKQKRILKRKFYIYSAMFVPIFVSVFIYYLLFLPQLGIHSAFVDGPKEYKKELLSSAFLAIKSDSLFLPKSNIFFIDSTKLKEELKDKYPKIKDIEVKKSLKKHALLISYSLREPEFLYCNKKNCYKADAQGFIYEEHKGKESKLPKIYSSLDSDKIIKAFLPKQDLAIARKIIKKMNASGFPVRKIKIEKNDEAVFVYLDKFYLKFTKINLDKELSYLDFLLKDAFKKELDNLEYIDLRFLPKVFYKNKQAEAIQSEI